MLQKLKRVIANIIYKPPPNYTITMLLPDTKEKTWQGLRAKTRNMIRKHQKLNHQISTDAENIKQFYALYSERMAAKSAPRKSYDTLLELVNPKSMHRVLYTEYDGTKLIGGAIVQFDTYSACWILGALTSEFLLWHVVQDCVSLGKEYLELGKSRPGSGSFKFKRNFCGQFASIKRLEERRWDR